MARYCIRFDTMRAFADAPRRAGLPDVLRLLALAAEFAQIKLRRSEKKVRSGKTIRGEKIRGPASPRLASTWVESCCGCSPCALLSFHLLAGPERHQRLHGGGRRALPRGGKGQARQNQGGRLIGSPFCRALFQDADALARLRGSDCEWAPLPDPY